MQGAGLVAGSLGPKLSMPIGYYDEARARDRALSLKEAITCSKQVKDASTRKSRAKERRFVRGPTRRGE